VRVSRRHDTEVRRPQARPQVPLSAPCDGPRMGVTLWNSIGTEHARDEPCRPGISDWACYAPGVIRSLEWRRLAGVLLIVLPTVMYGGVSLLTMLIHDPAYMANPLRQNLWRAGHAHAAVLLVLALVCLRYVDETRLSDRMRRTARTFVPAAAILMPAGLFLSMVNPQATAPNGLIAFTFVAAACSPSA
jgi:hypothetical protein